MTAKKSALADLPDWPAWLSREQSAAYLGVSPNTFDLEITLGKFPEGTRRGAQDSKHCLRWHRPALDKASEVIAKSAVGQASTSPAPRLGDAKWGKSE